MTTEAARMLPTQRLDGRHAIVTGAGRGLGRAAALALAEAGASVTVFSRSEDELAAVAGEVRERGVRAETCVGDVRSPADVERLVETAAGDDDLSICVTAAGLNRPFRAAMPKEMISGGVIPAGSCLKMVCETAVNWATAVEGFVPW